MKKLQKKLWKKWIEALPFLKGYGSFTKIEREVLYCVVAKNEIVRLKNLVTSIDPHAFISVTIVHDVHGEGFTLDENKKPIEI